MTTGYVIMCMRDGVLSIYDNVFQTLELADLAVEGLKSRGYMCNTRVVNIVPKGE